MAGRRGALEERVRSVEAGRKLLGAWVAVESAEEDARVRAAAAVAAEAQRGLHAAPLHAAAASLREQLRSAQAELQQAPAELEALRSQVGALRAIAQHEAAQEVDGGSALAGDGPSASLSSLPAPPSPPSPSFAALAQRLEASEAEARDLGAELERLRASGAAEVAIS